LIRIISLARALWALKSQRRKGEIERFSLRALRLSAKQFQSALFRIIPSLFKSQDWSLFVSNHIEPCRWHYFLSKIMLRGDGFIIHPLCFIFTDLQDP